VVGRRRRLAGDEDRGTVGRQLFEQEDDGRRRSEVGRGAAGRVDGDDGVDVLGRGDALAQSRTARLAHACRAPVSTPAATHTHCSRIRFLRFLELTCQKVVTKV